MNIVAWFASLTPEERLEEIEKIQDAYCIHCGREQPEGRRCQCWNDE